MLVLFKINNLVTIYQFTSFSLMQNLIDVRYSPETVLYQCHSTLNLPSRVILPV